MSVIDTSVIVCAGCERKFAWKPELAGRRVKCKCGQAIIVAAKAAVTPAKIIPIKKAVQADPGDLDGLFALAEDAERAAAVLPIEVRELPEPVLETKPSRQKTAVPQPLGYQRGPTARQTQRAAQARAALIDPVRDLYAPLGILAAGVSLYIGYFVVRFHLPSAALMPVGIGVVILTAIKAVMLVGFALVAAGPLGVSFGGLWTAVLKLAAIAVFADGLIAWVDLGVGKMSGGFGGGGIISFGIIGWPVAIGIYWGMLIYLFSMDPGDSWLVVVCLSVFDRIMRIVLLLLLLETFLSWGGVALPAAAGASHSKKVYNSVLSTHVDDLKETDSLVEAGAYIADGHQMVLNQTTKDWYAAGCPNVWFEMSGRDINGRRSAMGVIVELPTGKQERAKCYDILQAYYKGAQVFSMPSDFVDSGETYMRVRMHRSM